MWVVALALSAAAVADVRPLLVASTRAATRSRTLEQTALTRLREASRQAVDASREVEAAKLRLREARRSVNAAREELELQREKVTASASGDQEAAAKYEEELGRGRWVTLACLFGFTFLNGLMRRSYSSAAPSLVAEGLITEARADEIFMHGFDAFAVGKFLVVPATLLLGLKRSLLLQLTATLLTCLGFLVAPADPRVQLYGWVLFRIFSAMAVSTMLPFVGAWFPRQYYGRVFALLFSGFQMGYLFCSYYWRALLIAGRLHWSIPFVQCGAGAAVLLASCTALLSERPPPSPDAAAKADREAATGDVAAAAVVAQRAPRVQLSALLHKVATRWVFWAMVVACACYSPVRDGGRTQQ